MVTQQANALFHRKTLNKALRAFTFPPDLAVRHQKIQPWIATLKTGTLNQVKEVSLHGDFLKDTFQEILGYRSVIQGGGKSWELHAEQAISDGGGSADGALGFFTAVEGKKGKVKLQGRVVAPIELKGAKDDLDRPAPGRKESAVEQGWRYANYTPDCRWVIVSNYRELRLYQTSKTPAYYERFLLTELADIEAFKRFYFLLCRDNFLPKTPQELSATDQLLAASNEAQEEITKQLYSEYKDVRLSLVKHFRFTGSKDIPDRDRTLIEKAQKTLDRLLFVAFCEDRGLLPPKTIAQAHDYKDPYNPRPIWDNYKAVFRWVDKGNDNPPIPGYNGGIFQIDPLLDEQLTVPDPICSQLKQLTRFDFDTEVSVDILGRIFEQSVTDLEELKAEATGQDYNKKKGKRKTQGVFYTPAFITQYIVEVALGGYLKQREQEIRDRPLGGAKGNRFQLEQIPKKNTKQRRETEIKLWETYRDEVLRKTRVIDPACGSGAFLIAAFDYLMREYERVNQAIAALELQGDSSAEFVGQRSLFDLNKTILNSNLYGVDLSPESVEITKLSLWLKTAEAGQTLTYLDDNIKVGNSIVDDPSMAESAFNWSTEFADVFVTGGFDVVIGNPPYVRQELLSDIKPYLKAHYESYDSVADLYIYFYEKGIKILKTGGVLSYIVTNKWLRAGYGEPLRQFFSQNTVFEQIIDFGHTPIFEDADTFPCIVAVQKPVKPVASETQEVVKPKPQSPVLICPVPREKLSDINLIQYVQQEGYSIPWSRFTDEAWSLEPPAVDELMQKIRNVGVPLKDFAGVKPCYGIKTGLNEAFLIDNKTRNYLIQADPKATQVIKPYLRGQDIKRWVPDWGGLWIILLKSSSNYEWSWSQAETIDTAEEVFKNTFPSLHQHLKPFEEKLRQRSDQGKYWWELRSCAYYSVFEQPKIITQDLATYSWFCFDDSGFYPVNTCYIWSTSDLYVLGWLCSPITWWICHRTLQHGINDTLRMFREQVEVLPIAPPTDEIRAEIEFIVSRLIEITKANQEADREVLDWLLVEQGIEKPGQKLNDFASLDADAFVQEVKKRKPKSSGGMMPAVLKSVRQVYSDYAPEIQARKTEALTLEHRLSDLVNQAYGLTPEEIDLMWKTAPPRMPIRR
ncbi:Eco57I restriction-modification methylase domain-containing protein [Allocoleopsis franciscana]|uniref:site-specific DNA-methyltransferase (adenine-specific) n=1 Tax=Allocoleopsis franciscana PCC 7113 TaxID=1173027 RepID=K9WEG0_9CYAN|nr:DNA methyltransferase [Allocoleopsis franciscana]AFZ18144.1 type I restriction-modification system methyltransferase subunit [Allocoleopsis franciscana PCC 7113]